MKTLFFGSSSYCLPLVVSLHKNTDLLGVITRPDSTFGRNQAILPSPIKSYAKSNQISYFTPSNREELLGLLTTLSDTKPDMGVVADYGLIIPPEIFNIPKFKTINVHFGKLPEYRGASPLQWSIAQNEKNIPVSIILMDEGLDTGDIIAEINYKTKGNETTGELYSRLFNLASDHIPKIIDDFTKGNLTPCKQLDKNIFVTERLAREDGFIPWELFSIITNNKEQITTNYESLSPIARSALSHCKIVSLSIFNLYRALSPWPGLWTTIESTNKPINQSTNQQIKKRLKILEMKLTPDPFSLTPLLVQLEGRKPVSWEQFKEGHPF